MQSTLIYVCDSWFLCVYVLQLWPAELANRPNVHTGLHFKSHTKDMGRPKNYNCSPFETRHKPNKQLKSWLAAYTM